MKKPSLFAFAIVVAAAFLAGHANAQQASSSSAQAPSSSPQQPPVSGAAQTPSAAPKKATPSTTARTPVKKAPAPFTLKTDKDKASYAIGATEGKKLKQGITQTKVDVDIDIILRGIKDVLSDGKVLLTDQEVQATLTALQADIRKKQEIAQQEAAENNKKEGEAFLAANKAKDGVVTLPDGLQYKVLEEGAGPKPGMGDTVTVNYRGTLLNGTEFDSSYKRGQPANFAVGQVIKGWTEALQLMPVGSKWQIFIPSDLAYGPRGTGRDIGPNATLVFEVELLSSQPKAAPVPTPQPATAPANPPATPPTPTTPPATKP